MGQIIYGKQKPRFCNLAAIQSSGSKANTVLANGEIWLVDTTNTTKANEGAGVYDAYIKGDGSKAASALTVEYLTARVDLSAYSTTAQMNAAIQSAVSGKQDTISDLATIRSGASAGATAYQKPSTGIPKTDLASAVQTSLGKADTALQSHQDISGKADVAALAGYTPTANFATINGASITGGGDIIITAGSSSITTIDAVPTKNSTNPVQSGGVYDAIEGGFYY